MRATTIDNFTTSLRVHVMPRLGGLKVSDVRPHHVEHLYLDLSRQGKVAGRCRTATVTCPQNGCQPDRHAGLAPKSVGHVHTALRAVLERAVQAGTLVTNPCAAPEARAALPGQTKGAHRVTESDYWTPEQARSFLASCEAAGDPLRTAWGLALATGLRRGELAGLRWDDVDLDSDPPALKVRRSVTAVRGVAVTTTGKTAAASRTVPLGPSTAAMLREHRKRQAAAKLGAAPGTWQDLGFVFTEGDGSPIHPNAWTSRFVAASDRAGLPRVGLHGARHFAATQMLRSAVPVPTVARVLGHTDASITFAVYSHAVPTDDAVAARAMETALYGVG